MESTIVARIQAFVKSYGFDAFLLGCVVCIALISYNLGRIDALEKTPLKVVDGADIYAAGAPLGSSDGTILQAHAASSVAPRDPRVVVSKASSSKKYHHVWCSGAKRITQANQLWFENAVAAEKAGYTLAGNCQ